MHTLEQRKNKWKAFYDMSSTTNTMVSVSHNAMDRPLPLSWLIEERIEWAKRCYDVKMEALNWLDDDSIPYAFPYSGTELFAAAFGCKVREVEDDMPFALPMINSPQEAEELKQPSINDKPLEEMFYICDKLYEHCGKDGILALPDIQSPFDIASLVWNKESMFMAMFDAKDAVFELIEKSKILLFQFLDEFKKRYGEELIAHYPEYYMSKGITLSEDELGSISPAMFEEFALPSLEETAHRYGKIGIHCCAKSKHQWDNFKKIPNMVMLNFNLISETQKEATDVFCDHCAQMPFIMDGDIHEFVQGIDPRVHVVIQSVVADKDDALRALEKLEKIAQRRAIK